MNKSTTNTVFIGYVQSACCNFKTLVVAENLEEAKAKVLTKFSDGLGKTYQESDVTILPFTGNYNVSL